MRLTTRVRLKPTLSDAWQGLNEAENWVSDGNIGGAVQFQYNSAMVLHPLPELIPQFSFHCWVNINEATQTQQLVR